MNGQNKSGSLPQVGQAEGESELGRQLNQLFSEIARTNELSGVLHNRLHLITKASVPTPERPEQDEVTSTSSLSPLADTLRTKGIELMQANNSINNLMGRLAI